MKNKDEILNKIITDLPSQQYRNELSKEEWYGWFEEAFDEGYKQAQALQLHKTQVSGSKNIYTVIPYFSNGIDVNLNEVKSFFNIDEAEEYALKLNYHYDFIESSVL